MRPHHWISGLLLGFAVAAPAAGDEKEADGFMPMFNGRDLSGWVNVNCAPSTFFVKDQQIITTGKPTGYLRTVRQYENFIAQFDWMHVPPAPGAVGNSGFFVWADPIPAVGTGYTRGIEVQVLVNLTYRDKKTGAVTATSQGDLFSIWGAKCVPDRPHPLGWARCLPAEDHCKGANEWNHYRVEANNGVIKLAVNGAVVSGVSQCTPRKGYLALESEGSECRFRNLKIKHLPSTRPAPDEVADLARGHQSLYTGLDLSGWQTEETARKHWQPRDTVLHHDGQGTATGGLHTEKEYADAEFIVDFRFPARDARPCTFVFRGGGRDALTFTIAPDGRITLEQKGAAEQRRLATSSSKALKPVGQWNRLAAAVKGDIFDARINGQAAESQRNLDLPPKGSFGLQPDGAIDFANLFVRALE